MVTLLLLQPIFALVADGVESCVSVTVCVCVGVFVCSCVCVCVCVCVCWVMLKCASLLF